MDEKYIDERLVPKIKWYNEKSIRCKKKHYTLKTIEITCALLIVPIVTFEDDVFKYLAMLLSFIVASLAASQELFKFNKTWILCRNTYEQLCSEKAKYYSNAQPYNNEKADESFVLNIEKILTEEHSEWTTLQRQKAKPN